MAPPLTLVVLGGLPATGKSTLADGLAPALTAAVFAKDRIEASLWRDGVTADRDSWTVAENLLTTLAAEQLVRGRSVILDSVARKPESRATWRATAEEHGAEFRLIQCVCSDHDLHRTRLEARTRNIPGWYEPTWDEVERGRAQHAPWTEDRLVLDAVEPAAGNLARALEYLGD